MSEAQIALFWNSSHWRSVGFSRLVAVLGEMGRYEEGLRLLAEGLEFDSARDSLDDQQSQKLLARAYILFRLKDFARCRTACLEAVDLSKDPGRLIRAGTLLARSGYADDAEQLLVHVENASRAPIFEVSRRRIKGEVLLQRGEYEAALAALREADAIASPASEREFLAHAYEVAGRFDEALPHYQAIARWPGRVLREDQLWDVSPGFWTDTVSKVAVLAARLGLDDEAADARKTYETVRNRTDDEQAVREILEVLIRSGVE